MKSWGGKLYFAVSLLITIPVIVPAQEARLKPEPWSYVKLNQLKWGLIPTTIAPTIQEEQVFTLLAGGLPDLIISPVKFVDSPETSTWSNCGVYFLPQGGQQTFVTLFGSEDPGHCQETRAVGLMTEPGPRPRLILVCKVLSPRGAAGLEPVVLSWNAANDDYERNERQTDWLYNQRGDIGTVANVRRLLSHYDKTL